MRGQYSIDFFLVLSIVIAFSILLYNVAVSEAGKARLLDTTILGKSFLDDFSIGVDHVGLSGNTSRIRKELFVPQNLQCLFFNVTKNAFYCFVSSSYIEGDKNRLESRRLFWTPTGSVPLRLNCDLTAGWHAAEFTHNGTAVVVNCQKL